MADLPPLRRLNTPGGRAWDSLLEFWAAHPQKDEPGFYPWDRILHAIEEAAVGEREACAQLALEEGNAMLHLVEDGEASVWAVPRGIAAAIRRRREE